VDEIMRDYPTVILPARLWIHEYERRRGSGLELHTIKSSGKEGVYSFDIDPAGKSSRSSRQPPVQGRSLVLSIDNPFSTLPTGTEGGH